VIVTTIARQAPVAGDLRLMLVLMEIAHHTGLIANQFDLINAQLMETDPDIPDRLETGKKLAQMARLAASELAGAATALHRRDSAMAGRVAIDDATINTLNREVFATTLLSGDDEHAREVSMRHVLIARSLERVGDNAVDIAEQVMFLVTGEVSHPEAGRDTS
jgi:phosphate transport system protein